MSSFIGALALFCAAFGGIVIGILLLVFVLKHVLGWLDSLGYITYSGDVPTWGSLGNAALDVQKLLQPQYEYVVEARQEEEEKCEEEDESGPDDPTPAR